jgi:hypothetical protein
MGVTEGKVRVLVELDEHLYGEIIKGANPDVQPSAVVAELARIGLRYLQWHAQEGLCPRCTSEQEKGAGRMWM